MLKQRDFYHVSLKAILKNKAGEILILKARQQGTFSGFYDLPGGRIDEDEFSKSLLEILKREISEESGIAYLPVRRRSASSSGKPARLTFSAAVKWSYGVR